jgi:hypothetical protein
MFYASILYIKSLYAVDSMLNLFVIYKENKNNRWYISTKYNLSKQWQKAFGGSDKISKSTNCLLAGLSQAVYENKLYG